MDLNSQGLPKLTKSYSHFPLCILLTNGDLKSRLYKKVGMTKIIGFSVQELVAKVKDTVANG